MSEIRSGEGTILVMPRRAQRQPTPEHSQPSAISDPLAMVESRRACDPVTVWRIVRRIVGGCVLAGDRGSGATTRLSDYLLISAFKRGFARFQILQRLDE
jgi:hypothetical protein